MDESPQDDPGSGGVGLHQHQLNFCLNYGILDDHPRIDDNEMNEIESNKEKVLTILDNLG